MDFMYLGSQRVIGGDISGAYAAGVASEDILKLIKPGGLKPDYDEGQRDARAVLADVFNPFHVLTGPPVSGKTWTIISVPSELLHENNFKVVVVAPTDYVLDEFAVRIFDEFQEHDNLKKKIICRAKLGDVIDEEELSLQTRQLIAVQVLKIIHEVAEERAYVPNQHDILEHVSFDMRMVEHMKKYPAKYGAFWQLAGKLNTGDVMSNTRMRILNRLLTEAKIETLHGIDVALLTCASTSNNFFHSNFPADFVVVEDDHLKPISTYTLSAVFNNFHPKVTMYISSTLNDADMVGSLDGCHLDSWF